MRALRHFLRNFAVMSAVILGVCLVSSTIFIPLIMLAEEKWPLIPTVILILVMLVFWISLLWTAIDRGWIK